MEPVPSSLLRAAGWSAYVAAVVSALGIVFLVLLYIGLFTDNAFLFGFGFYNDLAVIAQYLLAVPVVAALHRMLAPIAPGQIAAATVLALVGIGGVVVFQVLFLAGVMSFQQVVGWVGAAIVLLVGAWILITGFVGRRAGMLHNSTALLVLAALYVGYPVWAFTVARQLRAANRQPIPADMT